MKRLFLVTAVIALLCVGVAAQAAVLFDRGLPAANLNNAAGPARSNVSWAETDALHFTGDTFTLQAGTWRIDKLTIWTPETYAGGTDTFQDWNPHGAQLYGGNNGVSLLMDSGVITGNVAANVNVVLTPVSYPDSPATTYYEGSSGAHWQMWQVDFTNLNWVVQGGQTYQFGINSAIEGYWFNHASNVNGGGGDPALWDNKYLIFDMTDLASGGAVEDSNGNGWDKSSDINVRIEGTQVPEPMSIILGIMGLSSVAGFRKLRRK